MLEGGFVNMRDRIKDRSNKQIYNVDYRVVSYKNFIETGTYTIIVAIT